MLRTATIEGDLGFINARLSKTNFFFGWSLIQRKTKSG
jgi:hypothetical protein